MLANHAVYTFSPLPAPAPVSPSPLAAQGLRHKLQRRTSVVFDVKLMEDHVYVVVDEEVRFTTPNVSCLNLNRSLFCLLHVLFPIPQRPS